MRKEVQRRQRRLPRKSRVGWRSLRCPARRLRGWVKPPRRSDILALMWREAAAAPPTEGCPATHCEQQSQIIRNQ